MTNALPAGTSDRLSALRADLAKRKSASSERFGGALAKLELYAHTQPSLHDNLPTTAALLPDAAKEAALGVKELLAKLGIGNAQADTAKSERYAVASVQAATLSHSPAVQPAHESPTPA